MKETIKVLISIEIPRLSDYIDKNLIRDDLNKYAHAVLKDVNIQDLDDWKLLISIVARSTDQIGVFKRIKRYPSDKEFEVSISIPIPSDNQIGYGVNTVKESFFNAVNETNFYVLPPDFENYVNLEDYVIDSSKKAIELGFTHGFSCNGKKIKFQK